MKINEKNLIAYSISKEFIDKEGYLLKKGEIHKSFQRRWFVLKGNMLFYFEKKSDKEPVGVIFLEGCSTELGESDELFLFKLVFNDKGTRTYLLAAESQELLESWMKSISRASYDYLKFMVAELQKQLEEIEAKESSGIGIVSPLSYSQSSVSLRQRENPFNKTEEDCSYSDLWKMNESVQNATSLLCRSASLSSSNAMLGVNSSLPPNVPFRAAPPPPTFKIAAPNKASKTFAELHAEYGKQILADKKIHLEFQRSVQRKPNSDFNYNDKSKVQNLIDL